MATMLFTWVFLQAVLLWDIDCRPAKNAPRGGYATQYKGGSSQAPARTQPEEQMDPGWDTTGSMSGPGGQDGPHPPRQPYREAFASPSGSSQEGVWISSPSIYSGGPNAGSDRSMSGYVKALPPGPDYTPGKVFSFQDTREGGGYESETQELGVPPPPPYDAGGREAGYFRGSPQPVVLMAPASFGHSSPYDWMLITGQYPPGTYVHSSSSDERGRDAWQENHYIGYDYPAQEEPQKMQGYASASDQSYHHPGMAEPAGPGRGREVRQQFQNFAGYPAKG